MVVCRQDDGFCLDACAHFNDAATALCVTIERDFLKTLLGGCSTPISALAELQNDQIIFNGNIVSPDGAKKVAHSASALLQDAGDLGKRAALEILQKGGQEIADHIQNAAK